MPVEIDVDPLRLKAALRDFVALSAIPAVSVGREPEAIAAGLADSLVEVLQLDFAFVRMRDPDGVAAIEVTRDSARTNFRESLEGHVGPIASGATREVVLDVGDGPRPCHGIAIPIGVNGKGGLVVAASTRSDFPSAIDRVLLSLTANHAAIAFENARLIHERDQAEEGLRKARDELEARVAERTAELNVANAELSALRRVATLVAHGVQPNEVFWAVSDEVGRLLGTELAAVGRFEPDDRAVFLVGADRTHERWELADFLASAEVFRTGRSSRADAARWESEEGETAERLRSLGIVSSVASPIVVEGELWGAMTVAGTDEVLPPDTEERLEKFTELVATAIANAESREARAVLTEEQAALRRVATLVARRGAPEAVSRAVAEEAGGLLGADQSALVRFETDDTVTVMAATAGPHAVGERVPVDPRFVVHAVRETGRAARFETDDPTAEGMPDLARDLGVRSAVASPIVVEGALWGAVILGSFGAPFLSETEQRLDDFTELVATAIANAESSAELAASRRRIVAASDDARRRIERNLHDGMQQRLVSLALAVRTAEGNLAPERPDVQDQLSRVAIGLADAVEDLQEISRGIHPAILSKGGLGPALEALAHRSAIPVDLDITVDVRPAEPIEAAAYFLVSEALANAAKHSQASRIDVSLEQRERSLVLSVRDDGVGGANTARGSGLVGLMDRVEALGGSIHVYSRPGTGTQITAELPLELELTQPVG